MVLVHSCQHCSTGSCGSHRGMGSGERAQNNSRVEGTYSVSVLTKELVSGTELNLNTVVLWWKMFCPYAGKKNNSGDQSEGKISHDQNSPESCGSEK